MPTLSHIWNTVIWRSVHFKPRPIFKVFRIYLLNSDFRQGFFLVFERKILLYPCTLLNRTSMISTHFRHLVLLIVAYVSGRWSDICPINFFYDSTRLTTHLWNLYATGEIYNLKKNFICFNVLINSDPFRKLKSALIKLIQ